MKDSCKSYCITENMGKLSYLIKFGKKLGFSRALLKPLEP